MHKFSYANSQLDCDMNKKQGFRLILILCYFCEQFAGES